MTDEVDESRYYSLGKAFKDIKNADGAADTVLAGVTMVGKLGVNIGKFAFLEVLPGMLEQNAKKVLTNKDATEEQREKAAEWKEKADEHRQKYETGKYKKKKDENDY